MKIRLALCVVILAACSSKPIDEKTTPMLEENEAMISVGQALIESNDCQTCHHSKNKLLGPSYADIASRYDTARQTRLLLATKIINGGSGAWGDTPMNAHQTLSEEDAMEMVSYILTMK